MGKWKRELTGKERERLKEMSKLGGKAMSEKWKDPSFRKKTSTEFSRRSKKQWENMKEKMCESMRKPHPSQKGMLNHEWKGGTGYHRSYAFSTSKYKDWRRNVFQRDDFTCQECGQVGGCLHAHHLIDWSKNKQLGYDIDNGITSCRDCHIELHSINMEVMT